MKPENFIEAVTILTSNHSNEVIINKATGNGATTGNSKEPTLHITNCTASAIDNLKEAGFSLSMGKGHMVVEDYKK